MKKLLNDLGKELLILRKEYLDGKISDILFPIVFGKYSGTNVIDLVLDESLTDKEFADKLKEMPEYLLTTEEQLKVIETGLIQQYDAELSKTNDKFSIKLKNNILTVEKYFRISQTYYKNFLGIDIEDLKQKATESKKTSLYYYSTSKKETTDEVRFKTAYTQFENFQKARLTHVLNELVEVIHEQKIIPMYKGYKEKPLYIEKQYSDKLATIKLNINLDLKDDFDKNIKVMKSFLDLVDVEIEKRLNYSLYK